MNLCIHYKSRSNRQSKRGQGYCEIKKINLISDKDCEGCKYYRNILNFVYQTNGGKTNERKEFSFR